MKTLIIFAVLIFLATFHIIKSGACEGFSEKDNSCLTPDGVKGIVVDIVECSSLFVIASKAVDKTATEEEINLVRESYCFEKDYRFFVCCPLNRKVAGVRNSFPADNLLPPPNICGQEGLSVRITNGIRAGKGEFPWVAVLIYKNFEGKLSVLCGGSLINNRYIVTAHHCLNEQNGYKLSNVRLGVTDLLSDEMCTTKSEACENLPIEVGIEKIIPHEEFQRDQNLHDIALLRLSESIPYSSIIQPICLPLDENLRNGPATYAQLQIVGFGRTQSHSYSQFKMKANVKVLLKTECNENYENFTLSENHICAGGNTIEDSSDACSGDSGGPVTSHVIDTVRKIQYQFLTGIISIGSRVCGSAPGIYTKVGPYVDWIKSKLEP